MAAICRSPNPNLRSGCVTTSAREQIVKARQTPKSIFANRILFMTDDTPRIHSDIGAKGHAQLLISRRALEKREAEIVPIMGRKFHRVRWPDYKSVPGPGACLPGLKPTATAPWADSGIANPPGENSRVLVSASVMCKVWKRRASNTWSFG